MGLNSSIPYCFSYLAGILYPRWAEENNDDGNMGIGAANYNGLVFCLGSLVAGVLLIFLERHRKSLDVSEKAVKAPAVELEIEETSLNAQRPKK